MFSTKGQEVKQGSSTSKSLSPGVVLGHIHSAALRHSTKTDKKALELMIESAPIENFEGWPVDRNDENGPKFKGQIGKVMATNWTEFYKDSNVMKNEIMYKLTIIAEELGLREKVNTIAADSLDGWVEEVVKLLKGHDVYFFLKGSEDEYNGKTVVRLSLPKYKFCSSDESKLDKFDKSNKYHYRALDNKSVEGFEPAAGDDFEM
jgi:hypothetical protein